jgi:hypothetical protein
MVIFYVLKGRESWMAERLYPVVGNMPRIIIRARPTPCSLHFVFKRRKEKERAS